MNPNKYVFFVNLMNNFLFSGTKLQTFFVTLPLKMAKLLHLSKKKKDFFCFALDFS